MGKRKREADATASGASPSKKPAVESTASAAEKRQQRSERKSKKAKDNAGKKKAPPAPEQFLPGSNVGDDSFAGGEDFVSFNDATVQRTPLHKPKKASPRSERKKAKAGKAHSLTGAKETHDNKTNDSSNPHAKSKDKDTTSASSITTTTNPRFIVFVGNLPYTTTTAQVQQHFRKLNPTSIRHSTNKATQQSRGFAFLEFDDYVAMKTCLKVYHHSLFDPERTSKLPESAFDEHGLEKEAAAGVGDAGRRRGRRINVELTAGGGGKGGQRKEKIKVKNEKLWEERERRKREEIKGEKGKAKGPQRSEANTTGIGSEAVHPSRMRIVQH